MPFKNATFGSVAIKPKISDLNDSFYIILFASLIFCFFVKRKIIFKISLAFSGSFSLTNDMKLREIVFVELNDCTN